MTSAELRQELASIPVITGEVIEGRDSTVPSLDPTLKEHTEALFLLSDTMDFLTLMLDVKLTKGMREKLVALRKDILKFAYNDGDEE